MPFQIRPVRIPEDLAHVAAIFNTVDPEPTTPEQMLEGEKNWPKDGPRYRVVAVNEQDQPIGYGLTQRVPWMMPGKYFIGVGVLPDYQHRGIGAALYDNVYGWVRGQGARALDTWIRDHRPDSVSFAERRGFAMDRHVFESTLDPQTFDESRFAGVIEAAEASGIQFFTLADRPGEQFEQAWYEVIRSTLLDVPGWDDPEVVPYEQWRKNAIESPQFRPDCVILAYDGDRVAGVTDMKPVPETGCLYTHYTGVKPGYRGRNIALALKLLAIRVARATGAPYMRTNNDSANAPMLAVNRKLGYVPSPGEYRMRKQM